MKPKPKVLVIVGPTSSGKSALAVELARRFGGEIISADSRQVYKGLTIGTGKITKREMKGVPHHLLDVATAKRIFTAKDFVHKGTRAIDDILHRNHLPIIAGGTGFYIDALLGRVVLPAVQINAKLRKHLENKTASQLFPLLKKSDPVRAKTIDQHNKRRLVRALELVEALGKVPKASPKQPYAALIIGISVPKEILAKKITSRLHARLRSGMIKEARDLHARGLSYKRMESLGLEYRALAAYLQGKIGRKDMVEKLDRDIRKFAKRQITYWRRNKDILWFSPTDRKKLAHKIAAWLR